MDCPCFFDAGCAKYEVVETLIEKNYDFNGETVLKTKFSLPKTRTLGEPIEYLKINAYYSNMASELHNTAMFDLYPTAVEDYKLAQRDNRPFHTYEYSTVYDVTMKSTKLLSLYIDTLSYLGGAHPNTERISQTWQVKTGELLTANRFFKVGCDYKEIIYAEIKRQAKILATEKILFDDYENSLREYLNYNNFYITCDCFMIYYPLYTIAPYVSGFITFCIPLKMLEDCISGDLMPDCSNNCCTIPCPPLYK